MRVRKVAAFIKDRYFDPAYPFRDRLYFLFGTAGTISAFAAFAAAVGSGLPWVAAAASLVSFFIMLALMVVSFFMRDITVNRFICSIFLNFFMFPALFWVTGGVNCGMIFYFILGLCVTALILEGKPRIVLLTLALAFDAVNLYLGFRFPELAYSLSYEERWMDTISSFIIVAVFIISVILIMSQEYQKEHDKVARAAETDHLTQLYNQRHLMDVLNAVVRAYGPDSAPVSLVMLDLDDFKEINDTYGHLCGNQVLRRFASLLTRAVDQGQLAARYGGEEFILVLPGCGREAAVQRADSLRLAAFRDGVLSDLTGGRFSVSGGVAPYEAGMPVDKWIQRADARLYEAKAAGKNRIM